MYLHFLIPTGKQGTSLSLWFKDLDLKPSNDPTGFYESLSLYGLGVHATSDFTSGTWKNTVENVSGTITTTEVPEPGSLWC